MASYSITGYTSSTVTVSATGLTSGNTIRFFIRLTSDTSDATVDSSYVATSTTMTKTFSGLTPGTSYTMNMHDGSAWVGSQSFTTKSEGTRPSDWSWLSTIAKGSEISISASEWNSFCARINEFRVYKEMSEYSFTRVYSGTAISASICNQAWDAINAITEHGTMPSSAVSGGPLYASFYTGLSTALNSIP